MEIKTDIKKINIINLLQFVYIKREIPVSVSFKVVVHTLRLVMQRMRRLVKVTVILVCVKVGNV